jgi:hypothetical protein
MQSNQPNKFLDEFDFLQIFSSIIKFFITAKYHLIVSLLLGIIVGILVYYKSKPEYESSMTAYSSNLQDSKAVGLIDDLERYLAEGDSIQLSSKLGLSLKKVKHITSLEGAVEVNKYRSGDSKEGFTIKVRVTDKDILDSLGIGIKRYIESSEFVHDQIGTTKLSLQYNIVKTEDELRALDSLRSSLYKMVLKGGQARLSTNLVLSDISYVSSKRIELNDRLSSLKQQLQLCFDVKVVRQFSKYKKKVSPQLSKTLLSSVSIFVCIGLFIFSFGRIRRFFEEIAA